MNLNKVKICLVSPSLKMGGIERALTTLAIEFLNLGYEIHFISCLNEHKFYTLNPEIKLHEPNFSRDGYGLNKILFYPQLILFLRRKIKLINPDRVIVFGDFFSPITLLSLIGLEFKVYISDRTIPEYKFSFPIPQLKKLLYPRSSGFIAQTRRSQDFKIKIFGNKLNIKIIHNALPELKSSKSMHLVRENKISFVGRFAWEKDPEILILAFSCIARKYPDWCLELAGTGPLLSGMKDLVKYLNIEDNVHFLGKVKDVETIYKTSSILVLPSVVEGFPNTLIEAMSFGLPCICFSDIPYEDIIVENENGLVVKGRDYKLLASSIENLIVNSLFRERLGRSAVVSVRRFDKTVIAKQILKFMNV